MWRDPFLVKVYQRQHCPFDDTSHAISCSPENLQPGNDLPVAAIRTVLLLHQYGIAVNPVIDFFWQSQPGQTLASRRAARDGEQIPE